ncbi:septum site-determining protein MinC [Clostridium paraputrificum]|uniref:septum site-determining protein MinC n=1 Tax=Clostridium TaxID=1485 RepID=UPI0029101D47|nr:septum site-determining protein MinC [Clostridium sp.]MDU4937141.1 septum site-determining protein MinC [Clostridium sp.]
MGNDRIIIKGNKEGLNAIINIDKFGNFEEMLDALIEKLSKGKKFYKGSTLSITTKLSSLTEKDVESLKVVLFEEIGIKDIVFEDKDVKDKESESKIFNGVYEGRTKFIRKTVRGGQCVDFQGNIVIVGDVNSGAEVYAGGNIIVLGSIKGNVYAGVGGNRKAIIAAFALQPEILKIGDIITISPDDFEKPKYPEVAKVKDDAIIVEPYLTNKYIY